MAYRLSPVTRASLEDAPPVCVDCVFWQSRGGRPATKERWAERVEEDWGAWGTLYHAEGDRLVGFVQYGPAGQFPRATSCPPARRRPTPCSSRAPTSSTSPRPGCCRASSSRPSARRATAASRRSRPSATAIRRARRATSACSSTARCSRPTSSPTSASVAALGGRRLPGAPRARRAPAGRGRAHVPGLAQGQGGLHAGAGAAAAVGHGAIGHLAGGVARLDHLLGVVPRTRRRADRRRGRPDYHAALLADIRDRAHCDPPSLGG